MPKQPRQDQHNEARRDQRNPPKRPQQQAKPSPQAKPTPHVEPTPQGEAARKQSWWARRAEMRAQRAAERRADRKLAEDRLFELQKELVKGKPLANNNRAVIEEANPRMNRNRFVQTYVGPGVLMIVAVALIVAAAVLAQKLGLDLKAVLSAAGFAVTTVLGGSLLRHRLTGRSGQGPPENKPPPDEQN